MYIILGFTGFEIVYSLKTFKHLGETENLDEGGQLFMIVDVKNSNLISDRARIYGGRAVSFT